MTKHEEMKSRARDLRNNATKEENTLWYQYLRTHSVRWNRQVVIGNYIVDFYCRMLKLAVELDGSQHYDRPHEEYDRRRTEYLNSLGITVLRFTNTDINKNLRGVCAFIDLKIAELQNQMFNRGG